MTSGKIRESRWRLVIGSVGERKSVAKEGLTEGRHEPIFAHADLRSRHDDLAEADNTSP